MVTLREEISLKMRSRLEIMASILSEAIEGVAKTRIMYQCNLSHRQLQRYLRFLTDKGMLELLAEKEKNVFKTTALGRRFVDAYHNLRACMTKS